MISSVKGSRKNLHELSDKVETIESATAAAAADAAAASAMIIAVDGTAQESVTRLSEAVARLSETDKRSDPWSDWDILQCQEFYELEGRVAALPVPLPDRSRVRPTRCTASWKKPLSASPTSRVELQGDISGASPASTNSSEGGVRQ